MYENAIAQIIVNSGNNLYYHSWRKENSTHSNEIDFLIRQEIKSFQLKLNHLQQRVIFQWMNFARNIRMK